MNPKKFSHQERQLYLVDKLQQIKETSAQLASVCHLDVNEVNKFLSGEKVVEDKDWVQLGIGLSRLARQKGVLTEKEEKKSGLIGAKKISRTSIIKKVEALDIFEEK